MPALEYSRHSGGLDFGRCLQFPLRPLRIPPWVHQLEHDLTVGRMLRSEDLFLASGRERVEINEVWKLKSKPAGIYLGVIGHNSTLLRFFETRHAMSFTTHEA